MHRVGRVDRSVHEGADCTSAIEALGGPGGSFCATINGMFTTAERAIVLILALLLIAWQGC